MFDSGRETLASPGRLVLQGPRVQGEPQASLAREGKLDYQVPLDHREKGWVDQIHLGLLEMLEL